MSVYFFSWHPLKPRYNPCFFALETIGDSQIIIWWLIFEKRSFQFWRKILFLVILLLLYLLGLHWHPVESYRKFQPGSIFVKFIVNIYAFAPSHNSISKFQKNLVATVGNKCAKKPIFSLKWLWPKLLYASDAVSYLHYCNAQHAYLG